MSNDTNNTSLSFLDLPDEVYLHLFSFLSPIDLCQISNVCKKWYRLGTDDNINKFIYSFIYLFTCSRLSLRPVNEVKNLNVSRRLSSFNICSIVD
ncbi:unnamed protein product [Rotaria sp. Silwood2]|nr:unnamed protein product [Rotaria sp. Silwood2]